MSKQDSSRREFLVRAAVGAGAVAGAGLVPEAIAQGDIVHLGAMSEVQRNGHSYNFDLAQGLWNAVIGKNVKISSHTFVCEGVTIEDECRGRGNRSASPARGFPSNALVDPDPEERGPPRVVVKLEVVARRPHVIAVGGDAIATQPQPMVG